MSSLANSIASAYPKAGAELAAEIEAVALRLGAHPFDLANLINFESGFSPSIRNKFTGATGLIQLMPSTAVGLGTTTDALGKLSSIQQMAYVERYLQKYKGRLGTTEGLYAAVFYPAAMGKGLDYEFPSSVQLVNRCSKQ